MKKIALFVIIASALCLAAFAQDLPPEYLWTETITLEAGETLDLIGFIEGRQGGGFFAECDPSILFLLNGKTRTSYVGFARSSTAIITALVACDVVVKAIK